MYAQHTLIRGPANRIAPYLPVPSSSTACTSASTSDTENGLLVRRCTSSDRLDFWFKGTIASSSAFTGGTATRALESGSVLSVTMSAWEETDSRLLSILVSKLVSGGGSGKASETPESTIGVVGDLEIK